MVVITQKPDLVLAITIIMVAAGQEAAEIINQLATRMKQATRGQRILKQRAKRQKMKMNNPSASGGAGEVEEERAVDHPRHRLLHTRYAPVAHLGRSAHEGRFAKTSFFL